MDSCPSKSVQNYTEALNWTSKDQINAVENKFLQQSKVSTCW